MVLHNKPQNTPLAAGLFFGKSGSQEVYCRVEAKLVGIGVVLVVRIVPPGVTHTNEEVAEEANNFVLPGNSANLSVASVVADETYLGEDEGYIGSIQKLQPEVINEEEEGQAQRQQPQRKENLVGVVKRLLVQQPFLLYKMPQFGVFGIMHGVPTTYQREVWIFETAN